MKKLENVLIKKNSYNSVLSEIGTGNEAEMQFWEPKNSRNCSFKLQNYFYIARLIFARLIQAVY